VIVTETTAATVPAVIVKYGDALEPAVTNTELGTVATLGLLLVNVTVAPPAGAGSRRVARLNAPELPVASHVGDNVRFNGAAADNASVAVRVIDPELAVIATVRSTATA
jgi:hypothetical protein